MTARSVIGGKCEALLCCDGAHGGLYAFASPDFHVTARANSIVAAIIIHRSSSSNSSSSSDVIRERNFKTNDDSMRSILKTEIEIETKP